MNQQRDELATSSVTCLVFSTTQKETMGKVTSRRVFSLGGMVVPYFGDQGKGERKTYSEQPLDSLDCMLSFLPLKSQNTFYMVLLWQGSATSQLRSPSLNISHHITSTFSFKMKNSSANHLFPNMYFL